MSSEIFARHPSQVGCGFYRSVIIATLTNTAYHSYITLQLKLMVSEIFSRILCKSFNQRASVQKGSASNLLLHTG